jgi:hypothetical protein
MEHSRLERAEVDGGFRHLDGCSGEMETPRSFQEDAPNTAASVPCAILAAAQGC